MNKDLTLKSDLKKLDGLKSRIYEEEKLLKEIIRWRLKNQKVTFTNGCFDLLHIGHVDYLCRAADLGDKLIVALNADESVKKLNKGESRPFNKEQDRALMLAALHFVDAVIIFKEDTPYDLIQKIQPDVLVKGGDWKVEDIIGADIVKVNKGEVYSLSLVEGYSTTNMEEKIKQTIK